MIMRIVSVTSTLLVSICLIHPTATAATIYIGDAATQGQAVTSGGGPRADTVATLTYILHTGTPTIYTVPTTQQLKIKEVNFFADASGTLTPFVSRYNGGNTQLAASYTILAKGDALTVTSADNTLGPSAGDHLENRSFTVSGSNPIISVSSGDMIVAGWLQQGNIVYIGGGGTQGAADYIRNGDSLSGAVVGGSPTADSNFAFDRTMQFNIGFEVLTPEPASLALLTPGLLSLGFIGWRRRRRA